MRRWVRGGWLVLLSAILLSGCTLGGGKQTEEWGEEETATIKVMYYDEQSFFQTYGNLFYAKYPNINLEVVSTQEIYKPDTDYREEFRKFIEEKQPDILMLSADEYEKYAAEGYLTDLDSLIKQSNFDLDGILPGVIDYLKSRGDGKLYGMSPTFNGQALFYNKDLFQQVGVPLPRDQMSWQEVFDLAGRFSGTNEDGQKIYGLSLGNYTTPDYAIRMVGETMRQTYVNPDSMAVTVNTDSWRQIFQMVLDAYQSGALHQEEMESGPRSFYTMEDYFKEQVFIGGRAAMSVDYFYALGNLQRAKDVLQDKIPDWGIVTVPVDPSNPDSSSFFSLNQIFAINAKTSNPRAAWEFIKYLSGDEYARVISRSLGNNGLPVRTEYIKDPEDRNIQAFYKLKPEETSLYSNYDKLPAAFLSSLNQMIREELELVMKNEKSVDEALNDIQEKGQAELNQAKE